jgi:hypothetical protein
MSPPQSSAVYVEGSSAQKLEGSLAAGVVSQNDVGADVGVLVDTDGEVGMELLASA